MHSHVAAVDCLAGVLLSSHLGSSSVLPLGPPLSRSTSCVNVPLHISPHDADVGFPSLPVTAGSLALSLRTLSLYLRPTSSSPADGRSSSSPASAPPLASADTPSSTVSQAPAGSSSTHRVHRPHLHTQHPTPASFVPATNITARDLDGDDRSGHPTSLSRGDAWSRCRVPDDRISDVEDGLKEVSELLAKSKTPGEKDVSVRARQ